MSSRTGAQKNSGSYRIPEGKTRRLWMPDVDQIMEIKHFGSECSALFEPEERPSMDSKPNHGGTHNRTMTHHQLIEVCLFDTAHDLKKVLGKCDPTLGAVLHH
jgi:hypothetical protein